MAQSSGFFTPSFEYGARHSTSLIRSGESSMPSVPAPLGHSVPWLTGERGSPSMWIGFLSLT